jgi:glycosyltransferase involved in cell wall biosynthesis
MKILYDHQTFSLQEYGGISRIYTELLTPVPHKTVETKISIVFSNNAYLKELKSIKFFPFLKKSKWKYKVAVMLMLNKIYSIIKLQTSDFDIFHPTYYDPYFLKYLKRKPFVVTCFDMIHEKFGDTYAEIGIDNVAIEGKKILLERAARVIAISESTKKDIVEIYGIDKNKIDVVHLASSLSNKSSSPTRIVKGNYILFIGNRNVYKNFGFFITSVADTLKQRSDLIVVCGGGKAFTEEEDELINSLGLKGKVSHEPVQNDNTLVNLYSNALCFVFPSLYEGFGIPVLEAFSCGCPCALSNKSSLPEVGGDAAIYFDPKDAASIQKAIINLLDDEGLRKRKIAEGYERLSLFSWAKTREETFRIYQSLL